VIAAPSSLTTLSIHPTIWADRPDDVGQPPKKANEDYPAAFALLKDATASSVFSNMSNTVASRVIRSASFM
jgi:hypothetical protein